MKVHGRGDYPKSMADLKSAAPVGRTILAGLLIDGLVLGGAGLTAYGTWLIYPPAAVVVAGLLLMALGLGMAKAIR